MLYGQQNEIVARSKFMQQYNKEVRPAGLYIDEEFGFLGRSPDVFLDVESTKHYDVQQDAITLFNMDLSLIIKRFRQSADYLKILDDKKQESEKFIQDTFISLFQGYNDKMKQQIKKDFPFDQLTVKMTSTTATNKCNFRSILNSTKSAFKIVNGKMRRHISNEVGPREEIKRLEKYAKRHSPLKLHKRNKYKDLGFNYAKQVIEELIKAMGGGDKNQQKSTRQYDGGYDRDTESTAPEHTRPYHHTTPDETGVNENNDEESIFDPVKIQDTVSDKIKEAEHAMSDRVKNVQDAVSDELEKAKKAITDRAKEVKDAVNDKIEEAKHAITDRVEEAKDAVSDKIEEMKKSITDDAQQVKDAVNDKIEEISDLTKDVTLPTVPTGINVNFGTKPARRGLPYSTTKKYNTRFDNMVRGPVKLISFGDESITTTMASYSARRYGNINSVKSRSNQQYYGQNENNVPNEYSETDNKLHELKAYLDQIWKIPEIQYLNGKVSNSNDHTKGESDLRYKNTQQEKQKATISMSKHLISRAMMIKNSAFNKNYKKRSNFKNNMWGQSNLGSSRDTKRNFDEDIDDIEQKTDPNFETYEQSITPAVKSYITQRTMKMNEDNTFEPETLKNLVLKWNYTDNTNDYREKVQKDIVMRADWDYGSRQKPEIAYKTVDKLTRRADEKRAVRDKKNRQAKSVYVNKKDDKFKESTNVISSRLSDDTEYNPSFNNVIEDKIFKSPARNVMNSKSKTKKIIIWDGRYPNSIEKNDFPLNSIHRRLLDEDNLLQLGKNRKMDSMMNNIWKQRYRYGKSANLWENSQQLYQNTNNERIDKNLRKNLDYTDIERNEGDEINNKDNSLVEYKNYDKDDKNTKERWTQLIRNSWESIQIS